MAIETRPRGGGTKRDDRGTSSGIVGIKGRSRRLSTRTRPRALLLLSKSGAIGGMERITLSLARQFNARDWTVRTVFADTAQSATLLEWSHAQGVAAETHPAVLDYDTPHTFAHMLALRRLIRESGPDIVSVHFGGSHISIKDVLAVRLAGFARCVVSAHLPVPWAEAGEQKRRMTRLAAYLCHAVVANSRATGAVLREAGIPARKVHVVPCGVQAPASLPMRAEARARLGLSMDAFVIATSARLVPHKGTADLIEAAAMVPDPDHTLCLLIAGDGPERERLETLAAARLGARARFLGHVRDNDSFYAAADLFSLPTRLEGFGLVFVEAAFHGVTSVATRTGGVPDAIADGETGILVPPGDVGELAAAIRRLRDDPARRARLGEAARTRAHSEFTEVVMAGRYATIFRR